MTKLKKIDEVFNQPLGTFQKYIDSNPYPEREAMKYAVNLTGENTLKQKQAEFLLDTALFYNFNNRAVVKYGEGYTKCVYCPTETSPGCAIGRHLPVENAREIERHMPGKDIDQVMREMSHLIPDGLQSLGTSFLRSVQRLHDWDAHWDEFGITIVGKERVCNIIEEYKLDKSYFSQLGI